MDYLPEKFALKQNYPNPFNPETIIPYAVPKSEKEGIEVTIELFNMKGQKVRDLVKGRKWPGEYTVVWDGRDANGTKVGNGIYIYRMRVRDFEASNKMILLK